MVKRALAWIRHGEYAQPPGVPSAHLPHGLTPRGQEQARAAAVQVERFAAERGLRIDPLIDSSRLRRAWETASILGRELSSVLDAAPCIEQFDALAERCLGAAANLSIDEIETILAADPRFEVPPPGWKRDPSYVLPLQGAESLEAAGQRVARHVLERMRAREPDPRLKLFVGHGGAFRHAARALGLLSADEVSALSMHHGSPILFELEQPGSAGERLVRVAGEWRQRQPGAALD